MTTVNFFNQISGEAVDHLTWDFGDGTTSSSTDATVAHTYSTSGDYTVSLDAYSVSAQHGTQVKIVSLASAPAIITGDFTWAMGGIDSSYAAFIGSPVSTSTGNSVSFTNQSTGTLPGPMGTTYLWDFGDGTTSTSANPSHTYLNPSGPTLYFSVFLTAYYSDSTDKATRSSYIAVSSVAPE